MFLKENKSFFFRYYFDFFYKRIHNQGFFSLVGFTPVFTTFKVRKCLAMFLFGNKLNTNLFSVSHPKITELKWSNACDLTFNFLGYVFIWRFPSLLSYFKLNARKLMLGILVLVFCQPCQAFAARFLKFVWPFWHVINWKVKK